MESPAFSRWGRWLGRIESKERRRNSLRHSLQARQIETSNWRNQLAARIDLSTSCDNLAGYIELYQRAPDDLKAMLEGNYRTLMRILVDGHPTLNRPFYVDFNALPAAARPYVLAPFLGHRVGNLYPMLCLARSDPCEGALTYLMLGGPTDLAFWKMNLPTISAWLGGHWGVGSHTVDTITLMRREPIPSAFPLNRRLLTNKGLFLGIDVETGAALHMPFSELTSGTFIPGASGTGKSNCQHVLVQSLLANLDQFAAVYLVDGKDGVAFNRYRNTAPGKVHVIWEEADVWSLCSELVTTMRARNAEQRERGTDNATDNFIALVIDEMSTFTVKPSSDAKSEENKRHARFLDELAMLARRGRSTGLRLFHHRARAGGGTNPGNGARQLPDHHQLQAPHRRARHGGVWAVGGIARRPAPASARPRLAEERNDRRDSPRAVSGVGAGVMDISPLRVPNDFYPTPPEGTRALLSIERFQGSIWEPACGDGAISKVLAAQGYHVVSTDLVYRGYGIGGINFLAEKRTRARNIITNPPYGHGLADAFVRHALHLVEPTGGSVAMLLNLASLAHPLRHHQWTRRPPAAVYVLDELTCWPNGIERGFAAEHRYCWAVWRPGHVGRPALWWLSTASCSPYVRDMV